MIDELNTVLSIVVNMIVIGQMIVKFAKYIKRKKKPRHRKSRSKHKR